MQTINRGFMVPTFKGNTIRSNVHLSAPATLRDESIYFVNFNYTQYDVALLDKCTGRMSLGFGLN
jgi:hypothetical protein